MRPVEEIKGVGGQLTDKLHAMGIMYIEDLIDCNLEKLVAGGVSQARAEKILIQAKDEVNKCRLLTGSALLKKRETVGHITTNVKALDALLGGGVETMCLTEFYGEFGSGKSQFTHQFAVNVQLPVEAGGLHGSCIICDTEGSFRPERLIEMIQGVKEIHPGIEFDEELALENVRHVRPDSATEQLELMSVFTAFADEMKDTDYPVRLLVIDSLISAFRAEYVGRESLAERQQILNKYMNALRKFADTYNAVVYLTNQVQSNPAQFFGDPTKPVGGNIVGHASTVRCYIRKSKGNKRVVKLVDAPHLADGEEVVLVTTSGIVPPED